MPGRTQGTQFEIAGNRANLATAALELNQNSTLATSLETASQIMERGASHPISRRGASLPSINDYDPTTRRMDFDAPCPRCPFCGRPMKFRFNEPSTLQTLDCTGCQVLLNVPSRAGVLGIAVPVLARD